MSAPVPRTVTRYPAGEPAVYTAPLYQPVNVETLIANSGLISSLQAEVTAQAAQISDLISRVTALENA